MFTFQRRRAFKVLAIAVSALAAGGSLAAAPAALAATKQQLLRLEGVGSYLEPALGQEMTAMAAAFGGPELAEGLAAHHQHREPRWPPAADAGPVS